MYSSALWAWVMSPGPQIDDGHAETVVVEPRFCAEVDGDALGGRVERQGDRR